MKNIYIILLALITFFNAAAQNKTVQPFSDQSPQLNSALKAGGTFPTPLSLWDVKFNYNATTAVGSGGNAGVAFTGTEFWVSRWQNDTIYTLSPTGTLTSSFTIPGVTGVRAFTWDGQYLYAGTNTTTISKIDPVSKTVAGTITVAGGTTVRHITYDSTANGGTGGFYIGNFSTAITQIDMSGNTLSTIPAATHGLTAMYGSAIDHWTAGGPYLWIFDQGGASQARIVRLQLPTGVQTGVIHDVMTDVGTGVNGGLAGGLFITNQLYPERTIVGLLQGTPNRLFGYELNDYTPPAIDASLDTLRSNVPYLQMPLVHVAPMNFTGSVKNNGINTISGIINVDISQGGSSVYASAPPFSNLAPGSAANVTTTTLYTPPAMATYDITGVVDVTNDTIAINDSIKYSVIVGDTIFARENETTATSSLGIGNGTGGTLGQRFSTTVPDVATSVSFYLTGPSAGDTVSAAIYSFGTTPGAILASTADYIIQPSDTNGGWFTLPLASGPLNLPVGNYYVGIREHSDNITLGTTPTNYRPGAGWVNILPGTTWNTTEFYGFQRTYLLRLNVLGINTSVSELSFENLIKVYPNPTTGKVVIDAGIEINQYSVTNILGEVVYIGNSDNKNAIDLSHLTSGNYFIKFTGEDFVHVQKILIEN